MNKQQVKKLAGDIACILVGSFLFAFATNGIYIQYKLLSTGFNGVSLLLNYMFGWSVSVLSFVLNIVFVIIGVKFINKMFAIKSIIGISSVSIFLHLTKGWVLPIDNIMMAIISGSVILGGGVGLALRHDGALGGMNILGKIINKYFGVSIGTVDMVFNLVLVICAGLVFDINIALYTVLARFIANRVIDNVMEGFNRKKTVIIISDKYREIANRIMISPKRGITYLNGEGAYTGLDKHMIYCVIKLTQVGKVKQIVKKEDPNAFMTIIDTKEVVGKGFI
jgi:uncharacterized membrane-anchored protein YitT (DUF2179 family)